MQTLAYWKQVVYEVSEMFKRLAVDVRSEVIWVTLYKQ